MLQLSIFYIGQMKQTDFALVRHLVSRRRCSTSLYTRPMPNRCLLNVGASGRVMMAFNIRAAAGAGAAPRRRRTDTA
jgi:hypothetical protein